MDKRILIVEHDPHAADQLREFLSPPDRPPLHIHLETSGQQALEAAHNLQPDCIVADIHLPDMTGTDFLATLKNQHHNLLPCAVVMVRRPGEEPRSFEAIKIGAQDCVVLGRINTNGMTRAVNRAIEKFDLQRELLEKQHYLEQSNAELLKARNELEQQVARRTADLEQANEQLKAEIAEREAIEDSLRAGRERFIALVANVPGAIYSCSDTPERTLYFVSAYIEQITGFPPKTFLENTNHQFEEIIHPDDRAEVRAKFQEQLQANGSYALEYRILHRNGAVLWVLDKGQKILGEDGVVMSLEGILFDITERRKLEEERLKTSKLESIGLLAGGVAHDLNNILTAISANVQLGLLEQECGQDVSPRLQNANNACGSAADLAKQLLTFAKGGAPVRKPIDLGKLVEKTVSFSLHGSRVTSELNAPAGEFFSEIDENQISQVINNLVINADQSMLNGGRLRVELEHFQHDGQEIPQLPAGAYAKISVADTGSGIAPDQVEKIFDPYFTTKKHGSGLGLATSYSIIKRHHGIITVDSEINKGTRFDIYLPALPDGSRVAAEQKDFQPRGGLKVLFMDDNELIRTAVSNLLSTMGYDVALAEHGEEAVALYQQALQNDKPFGFVMLDLTVPGGMGGKETFEKLKEIDPRVVAIVVSGYSDDALMADCQKHGFRAALTKPFTLNAVKEVLAQIETEIVQSKS